jgi:hypothetical protein
MFFEKSLFLKRFSCSVFPEDSPHAELQSFSERRSARQPDPKCLFLARRTEFTPLKIAPTLETRSPLNMFYTQAWIFILDVDKLSTLIFFRKFRNILRISNVLEEEDFLF